MPYSDDLWKKAKAKCRLNAEEIELAKRLGINPKSLMKNVPSPSQQWKASVGAWLREMEAKRQKKSDQKKRRKENAAAKNAPKSE
jgi:hypothetical protein